MAYNELLDDDTKHTHKHTLLGWAGGALLTEWGPDPFPGWQFL